MGSAIARQAAEDACADELSATTAAETATKIPVLFKVASSNSATPAQRFLKPAQSNKQGLFRHEAAAMSNVLCRRVARE